MCENVLKCVRYEKDLIEAKLNIEKILVDCVLLM